jgi:hypothetical protein
MPIPRWWRTTKLDAVGILLQRLGSLSFGIAIVPSFAHYAAGKILLGSVFAVAIGVALFWFAEYRAKSMSEWHETP